MAELEVVESSFLDGIERALWQFNFSQVDLLVDGIFSQPDITQVTLEAATGRIFERGAASDVPSITRDFDLEFTRDTGEIEPLGTLSVVLSLGSIRDRLWSQLLAILASNFLKTTAAAVLMLIIFDRMVSRHLVKITQHIRDEPVQADGVSLSLDRKPSSEEDELDAIGNALNESRRRLQEANRITLAHEAQLETVLNAATSGIVALDRDGRIAMINNPARHFLGGVSDEVPFDWPEAAQFLDVETHELLEASADPLRRAMAGHEFRYQTHLMNRMNPGEERRYVRISSTKLTTEVAGVALVLVIDDVSNEERNRQVVERKSRLDALGQLTGGIAHDFNNLLAAMLYSVDLARGAKDAESRTKFLDVAENSIKRGSSLTSRLLTFARKQPGRASVRTAQSVFDDFEKLVRPMLEAQISVNFYASHEDLLIFCDQTQLETALMNLVLNARDAILRDGKGSKIAVRARPVRATSKDVEARQKGKPVAEPEDDAPTDSYRFVEISVEDNGPGMNEETLARSTDPFFTTKETNSGTGLGLAMVYGFVRQSDGDLRIYSEEGVGTTVQLTLPRGAIEGVRETRMPDEVAAMGNGETVLIAEDETQLRVMMAEVIESLGYIVESVASGAEAMEVIESTAKVDLLLTDVVMPGAIGGFELARKARVLRPDLPVVYMSGYTGFTASEMGAVQAPILQKPTPPAVLADALAQALETNQG